MTKKENARSDDKVPPFLSSASGSVNQAEISIINNEIKSNAQPRSNYKTSVPERIKNKVGEYVLIHERKSALEKFGKKYPKYTFIRISVNNSKKKIEKDKRSNNAPVHRRKGRPNLLDDEFLLKVKDMVTGVGMVGRYYLQFLILLF